MYLICLCIRTEVHNWPMNQMPVPEPGYMGSYMTAIGCYRRLDLLGCQLESEGVANGLARWASRVIDLP